MIHKDVTILIADRNPNVRDFLKREMAAEKYRVIVAVDGKNLLEIAARSPRIADILIVDPELPDMDASEIVDKLCRRTPPLPVIIHGLPEEDIAYRGSHSGIFIEKGSRSVEEIKQIVHKMVGE
jgi:DNA-binding response OmpR family regulator